MPNYKIEDLDLTSRRSLEIDSIDRDQAIVRYFYHAGEFWTARIPLNHIESIHGQAFNFSGFKRKRSRSGGDVVRDRRGNPRPRFGFINHVQSRFRMQPDHPVELFELGRDTSGAPSLKLQDFVYSIEAVGPPGATFDFRNAMSGRFMCAHRFLSTQEMVFECVVVLNYYIRESPPLPLSEDEKRQVVEKSLRRSDQAGLDEAYYLFRVCGTNNCTSNPFVIIDSSVQYKWRQRIGSLLYRFPLNPRFYLRIRGLDSDPSHFAIVRDEFADFIRDPDTRQRKREVVRAEIRKRRNAQQRKEQCQHAVSDQTN